MLKCHGVCQKFLRICDLICYSACSAVSHSVILQPCLGFYLFCRSSAILILHFPTPWKKLIGLKSEPQLKNAGFICPLSARFIFQIFSSLMSNKTTQTPRLNLHIFPPRKYYFICVENCIKFNWLLNPGSHFVVSSSPHTVRKSHFANLIKSFKLLLTSSILQLFKFSSWTSLIQTVVTYTVSLLTSLALSLESSSKLHSLQLQRDHTPLACWRRSVSSAQSDRL